MIPIHTFLVAAVRLWLQVPAGTWVVGNMGKADGYLFMDCYVIYYLNKEFYNSLFYIFIDSDVGGKYLLFDVIRDCTIRHITNNVIIYWLFNRSYIII